MPNREPLTVDIADPESIKAALKRAEQEVVSRDVAVREAVEGLRYWSTMELRLRALANGDGTSGRTSGEPIRHRLRRMVNESRVPVDVDQAQQLLPDVPRKTISWTLWDLARKNEIQKVADGLYESRKD